MINLNVSTPSNSYPIFIGSDLNQNLIKEYISGNQIMIVSDKRIFDLYGEKLLSILKSEKKIVDFCLLPQGDINKNFEQLEVIISSLLNHKHNRTSTIVALGGGVVGDISGFAAAIYQRGINFIQIPTTLLAQVDSSVGGKTAINHPLGKNMVGAFYQPKAVFIDINTLQTLDDSDFISGIAEVIKYGLIIDREFFSYLQNNIKKILAKDTKTLSTIIEKSCSIKAKIVGEDEKEHGVRALLNLGHTFGHAIETFSKYKIQHGYAVSIGMVMAAKFSCFLSDISEEDVGGISAVLKSANLPVDPPKDMKTSDFIKVMLLDKKNKNSEISLVLLKSIGSSYVNSGLSVEEITKYIKKILGEK